MLIPRPVRRTATTAVVGTILASVLVAACGGEGPKSDARGAAKTPTSAGSAGAPAGSGSTSSSAGSGSQLAENLPVTDQLRSQLLIAGAAMHSLPASDYTGLLPGKTYYARDLSSGDYWAGAGLVPSNNSYDAEVRNQDEGAYMILTRTAGGSWHGWETGLTGGPFGPCHVTIPAAVLAVWGWSPGACDPPGGV